MKEARIVGHYRQFIKGSTWITHPLKEHLTREGASRKSEQVSLSKDVLEAFQALKQACMSSPILAFANYTKDFLLKTDASKEGLGAVLSKKQADRHYHPITYGSQVLTAHEKNYHSTKLEFLALIWVTAEHFKEYLLYQPFLVRMDNNPLTYIMTTPNLDVTGHHWVGALVKFNFQLEYQKGQDNTVADMLSRITTLLGPEGMKSVLDGVTLGAIQRAERDGPAMSEGHHDIEKEVCVATRQVLVEMHVTYWATAQREDPELDAVLCCLDAKKKVDLRTLLNGMEELSKFHGCPKCFLSVLHPQLGE